MTSRLWIHAGPDGHNDPVSEVALADLLRDGVLTGDTQVTPSDMSVWAPLSTWLPGLAPPAPPAQTPSVAQGAWTDEAAHPWRRYLARMTDVLLIGGLSWVVLGLVVGFVSPDAVTSFFALLDGTFGRVIGTFITFLLTMPGVALTIGLTGLSPGKWLFGVKVATPEGRPIGVWPALVREAHVWIAGLGLGLPLISLFSLINSYRMLNDDQSADWDDPAERIVVHRPMNALQITLMVVGVPLLFAANAALFILSVTG